MHRSNFRRTKKVAAPPAERQSRKVADLRPDDDELKMLMEQIKNISASVDSKGITVPEDIASSLGRLHERLARLERVTTSYSKLMKMASSMEELIERLGRLERVTTGFSKLLSMVEKLNSKLSIPTVAGASIDGDGLAEVMNYMRSEKKVVRDDSGNIVGWKLSGRMH